VLRGSTARGQGLNFDNQVLLLDAQIGRPEMRPNETLDAQLKWQGLRQWNADYTAFVHLIGPDGKLHGQVDPWPLDGTLATRDWSPGRVVNDPYHAAGRRRRRAHTRWKWVGICWQRYAACRS
jgi:hypothetical protein